MGAETLTATMAVIILVGFMGSGKTTLGRKLARQLGYTFLDADDTIEQLHGLSVQEIFVQSGEAHFRKLEREFITGLGKQDNIVLATGGGMPCYGDNMRLLNEAGITFYLKKPVGELAHRLMHAKKVRPLIQGKNKDELVTFITELLPRRELFYAQAHHVLEREQQNILYIRFLLHRDGLG